LSVGFTGTTIAPSFQEWMKGLSAPDSTAAVNISSALEKLGAISPNSPDSYLPSHGRS